MALAAGIVTVVMGFVAAVLLYEATVPAPRNDKRDDRKRRERLRTLGLLAAIVAIAAAYVVAILVVAGFGLFRREQAAS
jgi:ABC-type Fe3+ transport system permease subunit